MTNLSIFVESAGFVKLRPRARCSHRGDLKADSAAGRRDLRVSDAKR
jgi:hypothetical protein